MKLRWPVSVQVNIAGIVLILSMLVLSCDPRRAPIIRSAIEAYERESSELARNAIHRDPVLKELDRVCTEIARPADFVLTRMGGLDDRSIQISYYYSSKVPFSEARLLWNDYFARGSWTARKEEDTFFPYQELGFFNESYEVNIQHGGMGDRSQYAINCKKK